MEIPLVVADEKILKSKHYVCAKMPDHLLAIESSCDDTGAAVFTNGQLASNVVFSQLVHELYGGVVPEVASRRHLEAILPVVKKALQEASVDKSDLTAIACTRGPGLMGSLMVGYTFAKSLAKALGLPLISVDHMKAHILAHFIEEPKPAFPFLCLTVSGGHTQLVIVRGFDHFELVGSTLDDAAGEAFDKTGKLLGLPYPAGPHVDREAQQGSPIFSFSTANIPGHDFSFSGFKTSVLYFLREQIAKNENFVAENLANLCASIQDNIVQTLVDKCLVALQQYSISTLAVAGGVSANSGLRKALQEEASQLGFELYIPKISYCTDNAAMIGMAGYIDWKNGKFSSFDLAPDPRLRSMY